MRRFSFSIAKYTLQSILPYFIFSWLLLSVILFFQQGARYSDIFFNTIIPRNLIWQLSFALIPSVIAFTSPMAILVGVIIGLSKMQGDSELRAIRAAGVGNLQILAAPVLLGVALCFFTFFINLEGVPYAAQLVRKVALQTALIKLESPVEPDVFNSEISGFTIYVKDVDFEKGVWKNLFIINEDKENKQTRLITAKNGWIDSKGESSELVLENALVTTLFSENTLDKFVSENVKQLRVAIQTKRGDIIERLSKSVETPDELGLQQLADLIKSREGKEKIEPQILWQRRVILSVAPLMFALLGAGLVLRFNRSGKGFGMFLALVALVVYYLLTLLSEQLARTEQLNVVISGLFPVVLCLIFIFWLVFSNRYLHRRLSFNFASAFKTPSIKKQNKLSRGNFYIDLTTGLLDLDIILSLLKYFVLTVAFLSSVYLIFTAFELWKFAGTIENGTVLLLTYLFFLLPFIYIQLAPSALMIAILVTYIIKSRQNEIITWTAAGRSIFRLILPCFVLMFFVGIFNFGFQELLLPSTNQMQDSLRNQLRSRGRLEKKEGKYWMAKENRIYSFELDAQGISQREVKNLSIFEFDDDNSRLERIYRGGGAVWKNETIGFTGTVERITLDGGLATTEFVTNIQIPDTYNPFGNLHDKPSVLNISQTREKLRNTESETEKRNFEVALEKKYTTLILPVIITFFTAPFALTLSRKSKVITIGYAVAMWLLFLGISNFFEQYGLNGVISPELAVWSPLVIFSIIGIILLSKVKT